VVQDPIAPVVGPSDDADDGEVLAERPVIALISDCIKTLIIPHCAENK
jgi:hypothetical protein